MLGTWTVYLPPAFGDFTLLVLRLTVTPVLSFFDDSV